VGIFDVGRDDAGRWVGGIHRGTGDFWGGDHRFVFVSRK
jgi:hypothetical protein